MNKNVSPTQKVLNIWALILIVWSIYRTKLALPEWFDEFIAKPAVFVLPVYWYIKHYDKKGFFESCWLKTEKIVSDLLLGLLIGVFFVVTVIISQYIKTGNVAFGQILFSGGSVNFLYLLTLSLATAFSEELLSRGFVLKKLFEESSNVITSTFNASILFFILHIPILFTNDKITGDMLLLFMVTNLVLSFANSFVFLARKSLFLPILIHTFYNLAIILYT